MKNIIFISSILLILIWGCSNSTDEVVHTSASFWAHHYNTAIDVRYGEDPLQRLDIYSQGQWIGEPKYWLPDSISHPTLIFFHGGGWLYGKKESCTPDIIPYLQRGWNVVNIEYRHGKNTAPLAVDDAMCAILWVADNADRFNINTENIVISGESAGGHLALISGLLNAIPESHACYAGNKFNIKAVVNWFGITDIANIEDYLRTNNPEENYAGSWLGELAVDSISELYSPVKRVSSQAPAIISIHGLNDSIVPYQQAVDFHDLLGKTGIKNELVSLPNGKHLGFSEDQFQEIYTEIFNFLDEL
ncbi:MAG: alpha/beta hydrolase [Bacteroidales bacterium]